MKPAANPSPASSLRSLFGRGWVKALLLAAAVAIAYQPVWRAGFIWDDDAYVTGNKTLRDPQGLRQIWFDIQATPQYYPLVHTSYWLEHKVWGLKPLGYHLSNVALHALAAVLLWRVLARLRVPGAWLAAAIFALHPIEVESVAWITERKNVLSAIFYFMSALAYLRFAGHPGGTARWKWYGMAMVLFVAALLSKTVTCSLPAALLLVTWWKQGRVRRAELLPLAPFFVIGALLGTLTVWLERHHVGAQGAEWSLSLLQRCVLAGRVPWFYAGKLLWPSDLAFIYPRWDIPGTPGQWLFPLAAIGVVVALWVGRRRFGRGPLVAVLFFAGTLGPALGFVDVYPFRYSFVADHFQYLAGIGLIVLCAAGLYRLPPAVPAGLLIVLGALTWQRCGVYRDLETLWRDTIAKNPNSWLAHNNLGLELERRDRFDEAFDQYTEAQRVNPGYSETYNNLGNILVRRQQLDEAIRNYRKALEIRPEYVDPLNSLGVCLAMKGDYDGAITWFDRALQLAPNYVRAHINLGNTARMQNRLEDAIEHYTRASRLAPGNAGVHNSLALALEEKGLLKEAAAHYRESLKINAADAGAHLRLARVLAELGLEAEATVETKEALRLNPDFPEALRLLEALQSPAPK